MTQPTNPENSGTDQRWLDAVPIGAIGAAVSDVAAVAGKLIHTIDERIEEGAGLTGSVATKLQRALSARVRGVVKRVDSVLGRMKGVIDNALIDSTVSIQPIREKLGLIGDTTQSPVEIEAPFTPVITPLPSIPPIGDCVSGTPWPRRTMDYTPLGLNPHIYGGDRAGKHTPERTVYYFLWDCRDGEAINFRYFAWDLDLPPVFPLSQPHAGPFRWEKIPPFTGGFVECPCTGSSGGGDGTIGTGGDVTIGTGNDTIPVTPACCKINPSSKDASPSSCFPPPKVDESDIRNVRIIPWGEKRGKEAWVNSECGLRAISEALSIHEPVGPVIDEVSDSDWFNISDTNMVAIGQTYSLLTAPDYDGPLPDECKVDERQYVCNPFRE